jgi:hypothetical protein
MSKSACGILNPDKLHRDLRMMKWRRRKKTFTETKLTKAGEKAER